MQEVLDPKFKSVVRTMTMICVIVLSGCNGSTREEFVNLECGPDVNMTFEDWRSWTRVNPKPLPSEGHGGAYVDIYVDDLAKETYLAAGSRYLECSRIVKVKMDNEASTEVINLTIMVKMPRGYDPEYNDWWYARYDPTGTEVIGSGKMVQDCRICHETVSETDYLFSEDVISAVND